MLKNTEIYIDKDFKFEKDEKNRVKFYKMNNKNYNHYAVLPKAKDFIQFAKMFDDLEERYKNHELTIVGFYKEKIKLIVKFANFTEKELLKMDSPNMNTIYNLISKYFEEKVTDIIKFKELDNKEIIVENITFDKINISIEKLEKIFDDFHNMNDDKKSVHMKNMMDFIFKHAKTTKKHLSTLNFEEMNLLMLDVLMYANNSSHWIKSKKTIEKK